MTTFTYAVWWVPREHAHAGMLSLLSSLTHVAISRKVTLSAQGSYTRTHQMALLPNISQRLQGTEHLPIWLWSPYKGIHFCLFPTDIDSSVSLGSSSTLGRWPSWCTHNGWHTVLGTSVCIGWDLLVQESPQNLVNGIFRSIKNKRLWGIIVAFHWIKKFA